MCFKRLLSGQDGRLTYSNSNLGQAGVVRVVRVKAHISEPKTSRPLNPSVLYFNIRPLDAHWPCPESVLSAVSGTFFLATGGRNTRDIQGMTQAYFRLIKSTQSPGCLRRFQRIPLARHSIAPVSLVL